MIADVSSIQLKAELLKLLTETFETVYGFYLDPGNAIFDTLGQVSAEEASIPVGNKCATIAAQVAHICFTLELTERYLLTGQNERADWGEVWRTVGAVTPEQWADSQARLRQDYEHIRAAVQAYTTWEVEDSISGAFGLVVHCAYHLGEIRQALCTIKV